jgi:hypothetical protein
VTAHILAYDGSDGVSARAVALLREVAEQLDSQADLIAATMVQTYEAEIPTYRNIADASLREDVQSVSAAMVWLWLTVMSTGHPVDASLLMPLTEGARRRAAQGIEMEPMLRAYRIGIRVMWSEIIASSAWHGRALQGMMGVVATWALDFADRIGTAVAAAYIDEAAHVARQREHRRSSLLNVILAGTQPDQRHGPEELDAPHCVVLAKLPSGLSLTALEGIGSLLEKRVGASLWTVRHCSVIAVIDMPNALDREQLRQRLTRLTCDGSIPAFGLGDLATGPAETRQSYAEATDALEIGPKVASAAHPVFDYRDLAPLIALLADPGRARRFAATALEPLAPMLDRKWTLPTVEAYLVKQGRLKEVAAALGVHQNTVKYRLNELRPLLDSTMSDGDRAATLLLALRAHQYLSLNDRHHPNTE